MKSKELSGQPESPSNRQAPRQSGSGNHLARGCPNSDGEERGPGRLPEIQDERFAQAIREMEKGYDPSARFETQLMLEGLLTRLEQARILPIAESPNPYNPDLDEDAHERWWAEHPQEADEFGRGVDRRNEILRYLYIGAIIGSGPWNLP